jgi:hypothetical protein
MINELKYNLERADLLKGLNPITFYSNEEERIIFLPIFKNFKN